MAGLHLLLWASMAESCPPPDTRGSLHLSFTRFDLVSLSPELSQGAYLFTAEWVGLPNRYGRLDEACLLRWYVYCHFSALLLPSNLVYGYPYAVSLVFSGRAQGKNSSSRGPVFAVGSGGVGEDSFYPGVSLVPIICHSVGKTHSFAGVLLCRWLGGFLLSGFL